jgi:hypothetical protein
MEGIGQQVATFLILSSAGDMEALDKQCTESTSSLDTDGLLGDYTF